MAFLRRLFRRQSPVAPSVQPAPPAPARPDGNSDDEIVATARAVIDGGDAMRAVGLLMDVLDRHPERADLHCLLGQAYRVTGAFEDAADSFVLALHHAPELLDAYLGLGSLLARAGRHREACDLYQQGVERLPASSALRCNLALELFELDRPEDALVCCEAALRIDANLFEAWHNRGYILLHLDQAQTAFDSFERALELRPEVVATRACRAHALRQLGRYEEAMRAYREVLESDSRCEDAWCNLAHTELLTGDFERGWRDYAWRFGPPDTSTPRFRFQPWQGESLAGKTVLVYAEQGIGDEIMFASCIPEVLAQATHCVIECNTRLGNLFARAFPGATVHAREKADGRDWEATLPPIDVQVAVGDLPRFLRRDRTRFPARAGYLVADPERVRRWRSRLAAAAVGPWIGVCWRAGTLKSWGRMRSVPCERLAAALDSIDARWVNLQRGVLPSDEVAITTRLGMLDPGLGDASDLDELAALISALDLVVSVDATVVHLSCALGRPTWVLLPFSPDWRYGCTGSTMPWYPSAVLLRQLAPTNWQPALDMLRTRLRDYVVSPTSPIGSG